MNEEEKKKAAEAQAAKEKVDADFAAKLKQEQETPEKLKAQLAEKEAELEKLKAKEFNFKNLEKSKEQLEAEKQKEIDDLKGKVSNLESSKLTDHRDNIVDILTGRDAEYKKILLAEYETLSRAEPPKNREDVQRLLERATTLATGGKTGPDVIRRTISGAGGARVTAPAEIDADVKSLAAAFNRADPSLKITDEDIKKYPFTPKGAKNIL